jgi:hypothetical protein
MATSAVDRSTVKWVVVVLIAFGLRFAMPYLEGRSNSWWAIPPMFPADWVPLLLMVVGAILLLSNWIRAVKAKQPAFIRGGSLLVSLLILGYSFTVRTAALFHLGFTHYANRVLTAEEWREISRFAQEHLQPGEQLPGPGKNLWVEREHRKLWSALNAATQVGKLDRSLVVFVQSGSTEILWGGALVGHWGVVISTSKDSKAPLRSYSTRSWLADDIATVGPH